MNKKGNFWFWTGLIALLFWGIIVFLNLNKFSQITTNADFILKMFIFSLVIGFVVFICASLSRISR